MQESLISQQQKSNNHILAQQKDLNILKQQIKENKQGSYQLYRFINLLVYILPTITCNFSSSTFSAIAYHTAQLYQVSQSLVVLNSLTASFLIIIIFVPIHYIFDYYGIKIGNLLSQYFIIVGSLVKLFINIHFGYFLLGNLLFEIGRLGFDNTINKFVGAWFPTTQIPIVNSFLMFLMFVSASIGTLIPALFLDQNSNKNDYFNFIIWQSGIIIIIQLAKTILLKDKPKHPLNHFSIAKRQTLIKAVNILIKKKNYIILFLSFLLIYGFTISLFANLSWEMKVYGFNSLDAASLAIGTNISGIFGCFLTGIVLKRYRNYRFCVILFSCISVFGFILIGVGLQLHSFYFCLGSAIITGLFIFPYLTTVADFATQISFPVTQNMAVGWILLGSHCFGLIAGFCLNFLFDGENLFNTRIGLIIQIVMLIGGSIILFWSNNQLVRSEYQKKKQIEGEKLI